MLRRVVPEIEPLLRKLLACFASFTGSLYCLLLLLFLVPPGSAPAETVYKLADFTRIRVLGVGAFGKVFLVKHEPTGQAFALKEMLKKRLIMCKQHNNVVSERQVLQQVVHSRAVLSIFVSRTHTYVIRQSPCLRFCEFCGSCTIRFCSS